MQLELALRSPMDDKSLSLWSRYDYLYEILKLNFIRITISEEIKKHGSYRCYAVRVWYTRQGLPYHC